MKPRSRHQAYNELVQLDEAEFMRRTQGTFKLGIQFVDWVRDGHSYIHGFGVIGQDWEWMRCHQYWLRANERGRARPIRRLFDQCVSGAAHKFMHARVDMPDSPIGHIAHAFHFDASLYARSFAVLPSDTGWFEPKARSSTSECTTAATSPRSRSRMAGSSI